MPSLKISRFMTVCPYTIGATQKLALAHQFMRDHDVRHLPVLEQGQLVGIVSQRDLYFIETIRGVDPKLVTVDEAMSREPFAVDVDASVERVVKEMAERKYGCAVVMDGGAVVGVFTTIDALKVLKELLAEKRRPGRPAARAAARKEVG